MLKVLKNQHRWKKWLGPETCRVLEEGAETLKWAWGADNEDPKSYPQNTGFAFHQIKKQIGQSQRPQEAAEPKHLKLSAPPPPPKRFSELIDDATIKTVYESQNANSYKNALEGASRGDHSTFRKIVRAIEKVYVIDRVGIEAAPPPRIHFLHRNLLEIAKLSGLNDLTDEGLLEFLEDLCPCGKVHQPDATRKFRKRWSGVPKNKS
jgi:hypothetical protein